MVAVPADIEVVTEFQDVQGFRALARVSGYFDPDISVNANPINGIWSNFNDIAAAMAGMSNAKMVGVSLIYRWGIAQEPSTETGQYRLVTQKAHLEGGTGNGHFNSTSVPAPKDALFLTSGQDNLIVVNPAAATLATFLAKTVVPGEGSPDGGHPFALFFGGQLRQAKPRRRRVLQGL